MIEPNTKYRVINGTTLIPAGTIVKSPSEKDFDSSHGLIDPEKVACSVPQGGSLYFHPTDLEPAA